MIIAEYTQNTKIPVNLLWQRLINVQQWNEWDETIEFSEIDGPIESESIGLIKEKGCQATSFIVVELDYLKKIVEVRKSYFGKFKIYREIKKLHGNMVAFTQTVELIGPMKIFLAPFIASKLTKSMKNSIHNLLTLSQEDIKLYEAAR